MRDNRWVPLFEKAKLVCECYNINIPKFSATYIGRGGHAHHQHDLFVVEHHYWVDIFNATIDFQMEELDNSFNVDSMELLSLMCAWDPRDDYKSFNREDVNKLVDKFYPQDFTNS